MTEPVRDKGEVLERLDAAKAEMAALGVISIGLFGSFATGKQGADSDVDLLVEFAEGRCGFDNFMDLSFLLEDLLGRSVELVTPDSLSPHIGPYILKEVEHVLNAS